MKVLQINSVCGIGSTGRIATDIHNMLIEQGHESYIAYGRDLPRNCDNVIKIGTKLDNYTHVAKTRVSDKHGFGSKKATLEFIKKVKEIDPDIIHLHNIHGYYINIEILFKYLKESGKPVIWTLHDCWSFTGHCAYFDYVGCRKWETGCYKCPEKKNYPKSLIFDNSSKNYVNKKDVFVGVDNLNIVTPSKWLASLVGKSFLNKYSIEVINNGIDLSIFKPSKSGFRVKYRIEEKFMILGVANVWDGRKGLECFYELAKNLGNDEIIVLVGLTDNQIKEIPKGVIGIKKTNNIQELVDIYSSADVFVNPTLEDNFPTTNLESLACGTPVITFNSGGSPECIDKKTGVVVEKGNVEMLRKEISKIKANKISFLEKDIIYRAKQLFSKTDRYNEYISLYKETLQYIDIPRDE